MEPLKGFVPVFVTQVEMCLSSESTAKARNLFLRGEDSKRLSREEGKLETTNVPPNRFKSTSPK